MNEQNLKQRGDSDTAASCQQRRISTNESADGSQANECGEGDGSAKAHQAPPLTTPARETAEKIVASYLRHTDTESIPCVDTLKELIESALTRSEEEKSIASDALAVVSEDAGELRAKVSTLTARLKEAETKVETRIAQIDAELEGEEEMWETEIASQKLAGNIVKESYAKGGLSAVRAARSFLTASTPVEKKA